MKFSFSILVILSAVLWISALTLVIVGSLAPNLSILRFAAIPDAVLALALTAIGASRWSRGGN